MGSVNREIGETMADIYREVKAINFETATREELLNVLESIQSDAKSTYASFSYELGWHDSTEEAEAFLEGEEEAEEEPPSSAKESPATETFLSEFEITDYIRDVNDFSSNRILGFVEGETKKAYKVLILRDGTKEIRKDLWLPKSQILQHLKYEEG